MTEYKRFYIPKALWFFTVNLAQRKNNRLVIEQIDVLSQAFQYVKTRKPFYMNAVVIMPDHLYCIWTMPSDDGDFSIRWNMLKGGFSRSIDVGERVSKSRKKTPRAWDLPKGHKWQRRFWAHLIEDQDDLNRYIDYIHWNPVKHGQVKRVIYWPYSGFHRYVKQGIYETNWGNDEKPDINGI